MRAYRELFAVPEVPRLLLAIVTTRLAPPMLTLTLLLAVVDAGGSYASGGLALTGYAVAVAVCVPFSARLIDRFRAHRILIGLLVANLAVYAVLAAALLAGAHSGVLIAGAAALGVTAPPCGPVARATWPSLVDSERLRTAFALDGALNETMYVGGPVLVSGLLLLTSPIVVLGLVAAILTTGVLLLVGTPSLRRRPAARTGLRRDYLGPLATGQVRLILAVIILSAFTFGAVMVGGPATATGAGARGAAGVLIATICVGSVVSALIYGSRQRRGAPGPQLALTHAAVALVFAAAAWAPTLLLLAPLLLVAGLVIGPQDTLIQVVLGEAAPERFLTEAYAWMGASTWAGYALGAGFAGQLIEVTGSPGTAFLAAAGISLLAAPLSLLVRPAAPITAGQPAQTS
ncbi:MFS family permease [Actinoplanes lutulentus]|uniref:Putative MFS family arabinose efflux permease n=1 Tax=Actinoplanes lutulentus TaxID=1287878 RepID=A0A327YXI2_9ACTN|nr:MFS transporter [Actinoplanes lutulentus]MBB2947124.1 MFS family permease [Actinoplanes lutulentus]RAK24670.1 putative MFS family arabinose efflux permease [Actinoplanes lutulentus]